MVFEFNLQVCIAFAGMKYLLFLQMSRCLFLLAGCLLFYKCPMSGRREHLSGLGSLCSQGGFLQRLCSEPAAAETLPGTLQSTLSTVQCRQLHTLHTLQIYTFHCTTTLFPLYLHFPLYNDCTSIRYPLCSKLLASDDPTVNKAHLAVCIGPNQPLQQAQSVVHCRLQTADIAH
jgi:hypothetical protein